ncbi:MAG: hypothetical protein DLM66_00320 [Candidatus Dormiibacter spiritus]|nr:MAG: hypothetical protein DLM66_00320 [Candidatus Dormibacteraeota bacterium]
MFGINQSRVYQMLTDPPGAPPTYAAGVLVPGSQSLTAKLGMDIKQLRGDNSLLAADAVFKDVTGDLKYAKFGFDLADALMNPAAVADSGVTPNQITKITLSQADTPQSVKIEAQSKQVDYIGGDIHMILWKVTASSLDMFGFDEENYNLQGISYVSFPVIGTPTGFPANSWVTALANETSIAVAA